MAKNMENTSYRKLNVDDYDPEKYDENDDTVETPGLGPDEKSVDSMLGTNRFEDALHAALQNPPFKSKNPKELKDRAVRLVARVLATFKNSEVENIVKNLNDDEADILMKYCYKIMELCPENAICQTVLIWHSQLVGKFGLGTIIRSFTDRNRY